jgi:4'-phosphopantetheinyl transferase
VEVWDLRLSEHRAEAAGYRALLSSEEQTRAAKFIRPADAEEFVLGRGLLRKILAASLNTAPEALCFGRNAQGKPFLEGGELEFNLSHSRDRLLIAVTAGRAVGIDVEFRRTGLHMEPIVQRWFAPSEQAFFQSLENPAAGFFEIWAKKEAYVKARGIGIYHDLNTFAVPLGEKPFHPHPDAEGRWIFQTLDIDPAYAAAVVFESPAVPVRLHRPPAGKEPQ